MERRLVSPPEGRCPCSFSPDSLGVPGPTSPPDRSSRKRGPVICLLTSSGNDSDCQLELRMIWNRTLEPQRNLEHRCKGIYGDAGYLVLQEEGPRLCLSSSLLYKYACSQKTGRMFARILIVLILVVG